jgi:hypothetical protein
MTFCARLGTSDRVRQGFQLWHFLVTSVTTQPSSGRTSGRLPRSDATRQHHGQPVTRFVMRQRLLGQLHRHQPAGRGNWSTHSLPTALFQMAIQRAEAETATLAKLAPPHTAAHKLSHQLLNSARVRRLGADNSVFAIIRTLQYISRHSNRWVGQTLTDRLSSLAEAILQSLAHEGTAPEQARFQLQPFCGEKSSWTHLPCSRARAIKNGSRS